jgi:cell division septal protein FtsQ
LPATGFVLEVAPAARTRSQHREFEAVRILIIALVVVLIGGVGFLALWELPPTRSHVEIVIPNDRFQQ